ncbi:MAG: cytoplasmic protein [Rhizobiaceae bacterium]
MSQILSQSRVFVRTKQEEIRAAAQTVAFRLATGVDLTAALATRPAERAELLARLERLIERERQRGCRRHWTYDLNRHIALAQAAKRLRAAFGMVEADEGLPEPARRARPRRL